MFIGELLFGLSIGSAIGVGARLIFKEGATFRPDLNYDDGLGEFLERRSDERAARITFDGPDDLQTK